MELRFKEKIAVVTGGAKGIGAATATLLEKAGAIVEVLDIERGHDVTQEQTVKEALTSTAKRLGGIDILVNNAGRAVRKSAVEVKKEEWEAVLELNLTALFLCSHANFQEAALVFDHPVKQDRRTTEIRGTLA